MSDPDETRTPDGVPITPLPMTGRQRIVYEALVERERRLADIYLGAIAVLNQDQNPERFAQCAHSMRELVMNLPRYLEMSIPDEPARLGDKTQLLTPLWDKVLTNPNWRGRNDWSGEINDVLRSFLKQCTEFFSWYRTARPTARERTAQLLRGLDPTGQPLPKPIEGLRVQEWLNYRDYFVRIAHHGPESDIAEFSSWLAALDGFLLDRFRPRTFDDQERLDEIIREGENAQP